jgi:hypothetical protein
MAPEKTEEEPGIPDVISTEEIANNQDLLPERRKTYWLGR